MDRKHWAEARMLSGGRDDHFFEGSREEKHSNRQPRHLSDPMILDKAPKSRDLNFSA